MPRRHPRRRKKKIPPRRKSHRGRPASWLRSLRRQKQSPAPATGHSGSDQAPSDSTDVGFPLIPVLSTGRGENGSRCADKSEAPGAPDQAGRLDVGFAFTPARSTPIALPNPSPTTCERGTGQKEDGSLRIESPEVRGLSQVGDGNACKGEPAKDDSHRQVPGAVRTEPESRATETAPATDLREQTQPGSRGTAGFSRTTYTAIACCRPRTCTRHAPVRTWYIGCYTKKHDANSAQVDENACQAEQILPGLKAAADSTPPAEQDRTSSATIADRIAT